MFSLLRLEDVIELMLKLNLEAPRLDKMFKTGLYISKILELL